MSTPRKKILLLEDDNFDVVVLTRALKAARIEADLVVATDGQDAVEQIQRLADQSADSPLPTVGILDINVPVLSGFEVCEFIKNKDTLRGVPIVFFSGSSSTEDKDRALAAGGEAFFDKNDGADDLLVHLRTLLETAA